MLVGKIGKSKNEINMETLVNNLYNNTKREGYQPSLFFEVTYCFHIFLKLFGKKLS